ncbi:MAG: 16S rRNA (uracil(1498)-N(3))-methyltransferase, partial [Gammaproteobacteria bacterium]|nr:16S rRNA (uracil(1498)-N(3))-methyltransferase [Gammaproteobacteria bacterium]
MNLILLDPNDLTNDGCALITDPRRLMHLRDVHRALPGDLLTVGVQGGEMGKARLTELTTQ